MKKTFAAIVANYHYFSMYRCGLGENRQSYNAEKLRFKYEEYG